MAKKVQTQKVEVLSQEVCQRWYEILKKHFEKDLIFFREALQVSTEEKIRMFYGSVAYYELKREPRFLLGVARSRTKGGLGDWYVYMKSANTKAEKKAEKDLLL